MKETGGRQEKLHARWYQLRINEWVLNRVQPEIPTASPDQRSLLFPNTDHSWRKGDPAGSVVPVLLLRGPFWLFAEPTEPEGPQDVYQAVSGRLGEDNLPGTIFQTLLSILMSSQPKQSWGGKFSFSLLSRMKRSGSEEGRPSFLPQIGLRHTPGTTFPASTCLLLNTCFYPPPF